MPTFNNIFLNTVKDHWRYLIGSSSQFKLEARLFHSISLGIALLVIFYIPYNFFAGLFIAAISCTFFGCVFIYEYYRSRFLLLEHRSIVFGIVGLILLSINYFANSGLHGSTDIIWPVFLLLLLTICEYKYIYIWAATYILVFGLVHYIEYIYPNLVYYPFKVGDGQFTDRITAIPIPIITIVLVIVLFRRNYDFERARVVQRDAEKSRILSILSHDLRAPFIQVQNYVDLLNDHNISTNDRITIENSLKKINDQTLFLVTNLLYWSRSQLDGIKINIIPLQLSSLLYNTLEISKTLCIEKNITIKSKIDPELKVLADADMLQLVVRNLLQNAIKFTKPGGFINVETNIKDNNCFIHVIDSGIGISESIIKSIFSGISPSFGTSNEKGIGLGLQLCKEFIEQMGGTIMVESKLGNGTSFILYLPIAE